MNRDRPQTETATAETRQGYDGNKSTLELSLEWGNVAAAAVPRRRRAAPPTRTPSAQESRTSGYEPSSTASTTAQSN